VTFQQLLILAADGHPSILSGAGRKAFGRRHDAGAVDPAHDPKTPSGRRRPRHLQDGITHA
jgi:hypothetical protein